MTQKFSAIPTIDEDRLAIVRRAILLFLIEKGSPPDYAQPAATLERELSLTRDELRAAHMAILHEGLVAERARSGHIGLSGRGQIIANAIKNGEDD